MNVNREMHVYAGCGCTYFRERTAGDDLLVEAPGPCPACRTARDHEPQGEAVRLFEPAPNVMAGQLEL